MRTNLAAPGRATYVGNNCLQILIGDSLVALWASTSLEESLIMKNNVK